MSTCIFGLTVIASLQMRAKAYCQSLSVKNQYPIYLVDEIAASYLYGYANRSWNRVRDWTTVRTRDLVGTKKTRDKGSEMQKMPCFPVLYPPIQILGDFCRCYDSLSMLGC